MSDEEIGSIFEAYDFRTLAERCLQLEQQLKEANEVIDFYGDVDNWYYNEIDDADLQNRCELDTCKDVGGKCAREYKKKWG
jgi:hypothetical protein